MDELPVLAQYFQAPQPSIIYELGLSEGNIAKQLDFEYKRLTLQWLKSTNPPISSGVAKEVMGLERWGPMEMPLTGFFVSLKGNVTDFIGKRLNSKLPKLMAHLILLCGHGVPAQICMHHLAKTAVC